MSNDDQMAAERNQEELEEQQWIDEMEELKSAMRRNHGKFVGIARAIRDNNSDSTVEIALKYMADVLEEFEELEEKTYEHTRLA